MYACMYVCMHACMYVCVCMHVCMYVCMYACVYVCMYACVYVCMYVYICTSDAAPAAGLLLSAVWCGVSVAPARACGLLNCGGERGEGRGERG